MGKNNAPAIRKPQAALLKQKNICVSHAKAQVIPINVDQLI
jgi:hypothetical protein